jgi:hypothetical protein
MKKFSPSTCGFYDNEIHQGDQIPGDAVDITDEQYQSLFEGQAAGRCIQAGPDGFPELVDPPGLTSEELIAKARADRDSLLAMATLRMDPLKDAVELDIATPAEVAALTSWRGYRVALSRIEQQAGFPLSIEWPPIPG